MSKKVKTTKRKVGRPTLESMGLPPRIRHNFNMQRTELFDQNLARVQEIIANMRQVPVSEINQTEAVRIAVFFYALQAKLAQDRGDKMCPKCNGLGYIQVRNGDDDITCECCGQELPDEIPF